MEKFRRRKRTRSTAFSSGYAHPCIDFVIKWRWAVIVGAVVIVGWVFFPWNWLVTDRLPDGPARTLSAQIGRAFPFNISAPNSCRHSTKAICSTCRRCSQASRRPRREIIQQTDKIIKSFPEVHHVFGKIGRAETATDPAPFDMIESTIMLKDEKDWPVVTIYDEHGKATGRRRTPEELVKAMNAAIQFPGLSNAWTMPIKTRTDMLATGIKTPVGIKVAGPDLPTLERVAAQIEAVIRQVPNTGSVFAERVMGGNYVEFLINRDEIARYGLRVRDVQDVLEVALGGMLTTTVEGLERYTINLRYDRDFRENLEALQANHPRPHRRANSTRATRRDQSHPRSNEHQKRSAIPNAWIYIDVQGIDIGTYVQMAQRAVREAIAGGKIQLQSGYSIFWSGQYEYMLRAKQRLAIVIPFTLLIIVLIIYLNTKSAIKTSIVMLAVPFSLVGAFWMIYLLGSTSASQSGSASSHSLASTPRPASSCCSTSTSPTSSGSRTAR